MKEGVGVEAITAALLSLTNDTSEWTEAQIALVCCMTHKEWGMLAGDREELVQEMRAWYCECEGGDASLLARRWLLVVSGRIQEMRTQKPRPGRERPPAPSAEGLAW
jgi:hypothetical protein